MTPLVALQTLRRKLLAQSSRLFCYEMLLTRRDTVMNFNKLRNVPFFSHRRNISLRVQSNRMLLNVVDTKLPDRFHSFSRQSNAVVTYERRSFVHFGKLSPQNFSRDVLYSMILL